VANLEMKFDYNIFHSRLKYFSSWSLDMWD